MRILEATQSVGQITQSQGQRRGLKRWGRQGAFSIEHWIRLAVTGSWKMFAWTRRHLPWTRHHRRPVASPPFGKSPALCFQVVLVQRESCTDRIWHGHAVVVQETDNPRRCCGQPPSLPRRFPTWQTAYPLSECIWMHGLLPQDTKIMGILPGIYNVPFRQC